MSKSREIVDIIADAVATVSASVSVVYTDYRDVLGEPVQPEINYIFGSAQYFKDSLDEASKVGKVYKFPAIVLFCPITEKRDDPDFYSKAKVNLLICTGTQQAWSNAQRKVNSFENVLRPIYRRLLEVLKEDSRLDFGYSQRVRHEYSENYSYGRYGAYAAHSGEMVSEPIDAIDISNLELNIKPLTCR